MVIFVGVCGWMGCRAGVYAVVKFNLRLGRKDTGNQLETKWRQLIFEAIRNDVLDVTAAVVVFLELNI